MTQSKGHKQFLFDWRAEWLNLFQSNPTAAGVWAYMYWKSDKDNVFDRCEDKVCEDLGINRKTLCTARALIAKHGGFERICTHNGTSLVVKYKMLGFTGEVPEAYKNPVPKKGTEPPLIPENDTDAQSQNLGSTLSPNFVNRAKRDHGVNTKPLVDTGDDAVDTNQVSERVSEDRLATLASSVRSASPKDPTPPEVLERYQELKDSGWVSLFDKLMPAYSEPDAELQACLWFKDHGWVPDNVLDFWNWNLSHKRGSKYEFFSLSQAKVAADSDNPRSALAQYSKCQAHPCRRCKPIPTPAAPLPDDEGVEVPSGVGRAFEDERLSPCGLFYTDRDCQCQLPDRPIIGVTRPHGKLVDMVAGRQAF